MGGEILHNRCQRVRDSISVHESFYNKKVVYKTGAFVKNISELARAIHMALAIHHCSRRIRV